MLQEKRHRIRTTARRESRITKAQLKALENLLPAYKLQHLASKSEFQKFLPDVNQLVVEIGFGDGTALLEMAAARPTAAFVGVEVFRPSIGRLLLGLKARELSNIRVADEDARDFLSQKCLPESIDEVYILFPDPWPKKRHHKRRLIQKEFLELCVNRLIDGGLLYIATDWEQYAEWILEESKAIPQLANQVEDVEREENLTGLPMTRYESKAVEKCHQICKIVFRKKSGKN